MPWRSPRGAAVASILTLAVVAPVAFLTVMTGFAVYDDEGYFLSGLRGYEHGVALYNDLYTQYGPFYWQFTSGLFAATGIPIDHDTGRVMTLVVWVATAGLCAATVWRLTASTLVAAGTAALALHTLYSYGAEPIAAGHIGALFIAALAFALTLRRSVRFWAAGLAVACLLLIKVNVGCFALLGVLLPLAAGAPRRGLLRPWPVIITVAACVGPLVLVSPHISDNGFLEFGLHVSLAVCALSFVLWAAPSADTTGVSERRLLLGLVYFVVADVLVTWATSSSLSAIWHGVVTDALRQPGLLSFATLIPTGTIVLDLACVCVAAAIYRNRAAFLARIGTTRGAAAIGTARLLGGILVWLVMSSLHAALAYSVTPVWLAVVPSARTSEDRRASIVLVASVAVIQTLQVYPVAGSQTGWSSLLLVVVGGVLIVMGIQDLSFAIGDPGARFVEPLAAAAAAGALLTSFVLPLSGAISAYRSATPVDLPGAHLVRADSATVDALRAVTATLDSKCTTYISMPGLSSFYLFTGSTPPTYLTSSDWMSGIPAADQDVAVRQVEAAHGVCVLRNDQISDFWLGTSGTPSFPQRPLVQYVLSHSRGAISLPQGYTVAPPQ